MQRSSVRHWSERVWKKPRNTPESCACFFQAFAAQLIAEIHSSYLTDSGYDEISDYAFVFLDLCALKQTKIKCRSFLLH